MIDLRQKRVRWFRTFAMSVSQIHDDDDPPVELTIEIQGNASSHPKGGDSDGQERKARREGWSDLVDFATNQGFGSQTRGHGMQLSNGSPELDP
jgi:hypothetical protein